MTAPTSPAKRSLLATTALLLLVGIIAGGWWLLRDDPVEHATGPGTESPPGQVVEAVEPPPPAIEGTLHPEIARVDAARRGPEGWLLVDTRIRAVHRLDRDGGYLGTLGRRGEGPGEMLDPVQVVHGGESIWIVDRGRRIVHQFDASGAFVTTFDPAVASCDGAIPEGIAWADPDLFVLVVCTRMSPPGIHFAVLRFPDGRGPAEVVLNEEGPSLAQSLVPVLPVLGTAEGGFWWGTTARTCLSRHAPDGRPIETRCLRDAIRVAIPDSLRAQLESVPGLAARGISFEVPEHFPAFDGIFAGPMGDPLILSLRGDEARALDRVHPDGRVERIVELLPRTSFVDGGELLTVWDELEGARIRITPLDLLHNP